MFRNLSNLRLTVDFGSTYTKVALFDVKESRLVATSRSATTVDTDVNIGLSKALWDLRHVLPQQALDEIPLLACSSAAGGLKVAVCGMVPSLSVAAAEQAALGAGAKIVAATRYKLTPDSVAELVRAAPDIVLLAGGTDGGDEETLLHNARRIATGRLSAQIIVSGNHVVAGKAMQILQRAGKRPHRAANILPDIGVVSPDGVRGIIRELFMTHIVHAKGISGLVTQRQMAQGILPTPSAVLMAVELLSSGTASTDGLGDLVVVDIGGATTDVYSAGDPAPAHPDVLLRGLPEPKVKRTVEGDLGVRLNARTIVERTGSKVLLSQLLELGVQSASTEFAELAERLTTDVTHLPANETEACMDACLARAACSIAVGRHVGTIREVFSAAGPIRVQTGKDLTDTGTLIGIGGVLAYGRFAEFVLAGALFTRSEPDSLRPRSARFLIDRQYVLAGLGLLSSECPDAAYRIARDCLAEARAA